MFFSVVLFLYCFVFDVFVVFHLATLCLFIDEFIPFTCRVLLYYWYYGVIDIATVPGAPSLRHHHSSWSLRSQAQLALLNNQCHQVPEAPCLWCHHGTWNLWSWLHWNSSSGSATSMRSSPPTFRCTDAWISQASWCALQRILY